MKICHLYPAVMLHDGPSNVLLTLLPELSRYGIDNVVIGLKQAPTERNPGRTLERAGVKYLELSMGDSFVNPMVLPSLLEVLRSERPSIIQCNLIRADLYGKIAALAYGKIPIITVAHNVERYMVDRHIKSLMARFAERRTRMMVTARVAVSHAVAQAWADMLKVRVKNIHVIPNGLSLSEAPLQRNHACDLLHIPQGAFIVGSVGRLHPQKNYSLLLRAAALASQQLPNLKVVIVGDGEELIHLQTLAQNLGIGPLVKWAGRRMDVDRVIASFDVFALTSDYEGLPIALLEATRAGIPSVVTRAGGMPEVVNHAETGYVVDCGDVTGVCKAILQLAANPTLRASMGRAAEIRFKSQYSSTRMAAQYLHLYHDLIPSNNEESQKERTDETTCLGYRSHPDK